MFLSVGGARRAHCYRYTLEVLLVMCACGRGSMDRHKMKQFFPSEDFHIPLNIHSPEFKRALEVHNASLPVTAPPFFNPLPPSGL